MLDFKTLTEKHSLYGSWAIWEHSKSRNQEKSAEIIHKSITDLNVRNVIIGLNISNNVDPWGNFRGGKHDRKLKYAFNDSSLRGSYMTDLFKNCVDKSSTSFDKYIKANPELIQKNVLLFLDEMSDLKISSETRLIILGTEESIIAKYFKTHFQQHFTNNPVIYHRHYSSRGTDKEWVESIWDKLGIQADFNEILNKYK